MTLDAHSKTIPFETTEAQRQRLPGLAAQMLAAGLEPRLVDSAITIGATDQGIFELMELWSEEPNIEQAKTVLALQECINDVRESRLRPSQGIEALPCGGLGLQRRIRAVYKTLTATQQGPFGDMCAEMWQLLDATENESVRWSTRVRVLEARLEAVRRAAESS
jgi:hypothetical protein